MYMYVCIYIYIYVYIYREREQVSMLTSLSHPNVVQMHSMFVESRRSVNTNIYIYIYI